MCRLLVCVTIALLLSMYINEYESRAILVEEILDNDLDSMDFVEFNPEERQEDVRIFDRSKRNCFSYAMKVRNRAPKWLCW